MKRTFFLLFLVFLVFASQFQAQKKNRSSTSSAQRRAFAQKIVQRENTNAFIVVDERLAVLRAEPNLHARPIQRMRRGRLVFVTGWRESADGVAFYRVNLAPENAAWIQADAVVGKSRSGDDQRLARLVQASQGFDQIERTMIFLNNFPKSPLRPAMLLLLGDLVESAAAALSRDAARRLSRREMSGSGAPLHSFYLNYSGLDRYRRLGIGFLFNSAAKTFHYNGEAWKEILEKFPNSGEANDARGRLDALKEKMAAAQ